MEGTLTSGAGEVVVLNLVVVVLVVFIVEPEVRVREASC
jgi:hypothetical protein